jgi:integrase/recombinase XerD
VVDAPDRFLRDLRFGADRTESTTKLYASELALFLDWAARSGRDLERAAHELSRFVMALRTTTIARRGRGFGEVRSAGRINHILAVVREFYKHAVAHRAVDASVIAALYEVGDDRFLPTELLWFSGLRIGEALGLRRSDLHLMGSAAALGCAVPGPHLHVVPRELERRGGEVTP